MKQDRRVKLAPLSISLALSIDQVDVVVLLTVMRKLSRRSVAWMEENSLMVNRIQHLLQMPHMRLPNFPRSHHCSSPPNRYALYLP